MGDNPTLSPSAQEFDPELMTHYDGITGRGDTQEGADTRKNVLQYEGVDLTEDEKTRPMCHVGGIDSEPDTEGPSPECCRVYEYADFVGRQFDFCLYDVDAQTAPYQKYWQADTYGWHNEVNSWWCGDKVGIRVCAHPNDASSTDDKAAMGECRGGNPNVIEDVGRSPNMPPGINEEGDSIWIFKNICPEIGCAAVYEFQNCQGPSWMAYPNIRQQMGLSVPAYNQPYMKFEGSWDYYNGSRAHLTPNDATSSIGNLQLHWGSSESVKLDPLTEFETFFTTLNTGVGATDMGLYDSVFERENAFTHRNFKEEDFWPYAPDEAPKQCHNYLGIWSTADPHRIHSDMQNGEAPPAGVSGFTNVFGIKIREQYFPEVPIAP